MASSTPRGQTAHPDLTFPGAPRHSSPITRRRAAGYQSQGPVRGCTAFYRGSGQRGHRLRARPAVGDALGGHVSSRRPSLHAVVTLQGVLLLCKGSRVSFGKTSGLGCPRKLRNAALDSLISLLVGFCWTCWTMRMFIDLQIPFYSCGSTKFYTRLHDAMGKATCCISLFISWKIESLSDRTWHLKGATTEVLRWKLVIIS